MNEFMKEALKQAQKAFDIGEVPIGCVIVKDNNIIARAYNKKETLQCSVEHAEIRAIQKACKKLKTWHLDGCSLYVTLEPCPMCASAIMHSRIQKVYFGAYDPKGGALGSTINLYETKGFNHYPDYYGGIDEAECSLILKDFFKLVRKKKAKLL